MKPLTAFSVCLVLFCTLVLSCDFQDRSLEYEFFDVCNLAEFSKSQSATNTASSKVFEQPNVMASYHGSACASSDNDGAEYMSIVDGSQELPDWATNATVFLNGWNTSYLHDDHHLRSLGTAIIKILIDTKDGKKILRWKTVGGIADKNFDDGYRFCYHYTVLAWNDSALDLVVNHEDACDRKGTAPSINQVRRISEEAQTTVSGFTVVPKLLRRVQASVLPRGFGFYLRAQDDHHFLQLAYNLSQSETILENKRYDVAHSESTVNPLASNTSRADSGRFVSWATQAIFKDEAESFREFNDADGYVFGEVVSGIGGKDVEIITPPFGIAAQISSGFLTGCLNPPGGNIITTEYTVTNIPYEKAIPVLTGWDLHYSCRKDHHVREAGIWISSWNYTKPPRSARGKLKYTLSRVLRDDEANSFEVLHRVSILGLKLTSTAQPEDLEIPPQQL